VGPLTHLRNGAKQRAEGDAANFEVTEFAGQLAALREQHEGHNVDAAHAHELRKREQIEPA
jgi:hypothetical protein